jgi:FkbM family methyltransferase
MVLNLEQLKEKYNLNIKGVIHVGAHHGEEYDVYEKLNIKNKIFFEPVSTNFKILNENVGSKAILVNKAVGNENKKISINIETANNGQSNSILNPKLHLQQYPHIQFNSTEEVDMVKLDDYIENNNEYNFINADVQGYELEVLKGASTLLQNIDYIMLEINRAEVYENCPMVEEIVSFLSNYGFKLVEEDWMGGIWGDGFFIKN